jgi:hypothetical protein
LKCHSDVDLAAGRPHSLDDVTIVVRKRPGPIPAPKEQPPRKLSGIKDRTATTLWKAAASRRLTDEDKVPPVSPGT